MRTSQDIRQQFIDFFVEKHGHTYVPSSPVVPHDDPTLLFTNAGMNQFKPYFLGTEDAPYPRAANTQKCIRAGGKHNDLDDVGKDTYHHTFFEMLGNWSFGDYFKEDAIRWAWQLLTEVWGLEKDRLHATVFAGDQADGLKADDEAAQLWKSVTDIDPSHIHFCGKKDNFWEMGDTGPCGPCSEIHVDLTPDKSGHKLVNTDDPRVIEIWNLVFIQFNRDTDGKLATLPNKHVDTGMGFERVTAVLQGKISNYDTDIFTPLFDAIHQITGAPKYSGDLHSNVDVAYRVIADHARCLTFALTDGAVPSNEGRGYVLRRILRRAVKYGRLDFNTGEPFLYKLTPVIAEHMGEAFPELRKNPDAVANLIREEEESFGKTIDRGIELFDRAATKAAKSGSPTISGDEAFELYATFGFPLDLTQLMAEERDMEVDVARYKQRMAEHIDESRGEGTTDVRQSLVEIVQKSDLPATKFVGYDSNIADDAHTAELVAFHDGRYTLAETIEVGQPAAIVTEATPFYAEAGGQVGDTGSIHSTHGAVFRVDDTQKVGDVYFHLGELESGNVHRDEPAFSESDSLLLEIDVPRRELIMQHHTVTHLMNWALREVLGDHIQQRGSLVDDEKTRFDFSHPKAVTDEQLDEVQRLVNERIDESLKVYAAEAPQEDALKINGLRAVFGEKYPPKVRVVSIGVPVEDLLKKPDKDEWLKYSVEFCGGTHLGETSEAQRFVIVAEEASSKGVRRITAIAGEAAQQAVADAEVLDERLEAIRRDKPETLEQDIAALAEAITTNTLPVLARAKLRDKLGELQKIIKEHQKARAKEAEGDVVETARRVADEAAGDLVISAIDGADANSLRKAMDVIRSRKPDAAMMLAAIVDDEKVAFLASVPQPLIDKGLKAGDWVREVAKVTGGGGGGRPDMAQAGGKNPTKIVEALEVARKFASDKLG